VNWLSVGAVMVDSWQMLCVDRYPTGMVVLISCRWLNYIYFLLHLLAI